MNKLEKHFNRPVLMYVSFRLQLYNLLNMITFVHCCVKNNGVDETSV